LGLRLTRTAAQVDQQKIEIGALQARVAQINALKTEVAQLRALIVHAH
jgi:prefoldin subunit 5